MRHLNAHRKLGRTSEHRMSMLRNLATSLINARDERIVTTVPKAKELRPFVERIITIAKRGIAAGDTNQGALHARRMVLRDIQNREVVGKLFDEIAPRFAARPGGYTRIIRLGHRDGDNAELAIIELVGNPREESAKSPKKSAGKAGKKSAKAETSSADSTKKAQGDGGRRSKKTEQTAAEKDTE